MSGENEKPVVISQAAYSALCTILIEFVMRADAGDTARKAYDSFVSEVAKSNP